MSVEDSMPEPQPESLRAQSAGISSWWFRASHIVRLQEMGSEYGSARHQEETACRAT